MKINIAITPLLDYVTPVVVLFFTVILNLFELFDYVKAL